MYCNIYRRSAIGKQKLAEMKNKFSVMEGDFLTLLNIFNSFILNEKSESWCNEHYLNYRSLSRAAEIRNLLKKYLEYYNIPLKSIGQHSESFDVLLQCIVFGYFANGAQLQGDGSYKAIRNQNSKYNVKLYIHSSSILCDEGTPWIVYDQIITDNGYNYMVNVSKVKPLWLFKIAPHFYRFKQMRGNK